MRFNLYYRSIAPYEIISVEKQSLAQLVRGVDPTYSRQLVQPSIEPRIQQIDWFAKKIYCCEKVYIESLPTFHREFSVRMMKSPSGK